MNTNFHTVLFVISLHLLSCLCPVRAFNLSPKFVKIITDPLRQEGSYFGFSVLLRSSIPRYASSIIVSAPKANSTFSYHRGIPSTGVVYQCNIDEVIGSVCYPLILDPTGNFEYQAANGFSFKHRKEYSMLGASIDGEDSRGGRFVACAPRWVNQHHPNIYLNNGMCYLLSDTRDANRTAEYLMPLLESSKQSFKGNTRDYYWYAFAESGFSAHMINSEYSKHKELLLGAPGMLSWKGGIVRYRDSVVKRSQISVYENIIVPHTYYNREIPFESYFGYAVSSGRFLSEEEKIYYVSGAPRAAAYKGKVYIYDIMGQDEYHKQEIKIIKELEGRQMGEYFGSVICVTDVTGDELDDVIIGAPQHAVQTPIGIASGIDVEEMGDEGAVYVFINKDGWRFQEQSKLTNSHLPGSRFGSAISALGDLNRDGYKDIAVGAPYENDGRGAVYIYLGNSKGLGPMYSQKISAIDINHQLKGFGYSLSRGVDIDENKYRDLAVGAYLSGHAVLLKSYPVADIKASIKPLVKEIGYDTRDFNARVCLYYTGVDVPSSINVFIELKADPTYKRALLSIDRVYNNPLTDIIKVAYKRNTCKDVLIQIKAVKHDFSKPIELSLFYNLTIHEEKTFCKSCPILNHNTQHTVTAHVPFSTGCKGATCITDLKIVAEFVDIEDYYIIGTKNSIHLNITVFDLGEPAFLTRLLVHLPKGIELNRVPSICHEPEGDKALISCDLGNFASMTEQKNVLIELDSSMISNDFAELAVRLEAISVGENIPSADNNVTKSLLLKTEAQLQILGISKPEQLLYTNTNNDNVKKMFVDFKQEFEIRNQGPSPVEQSTVQFSVPVAMKNDAGNITLIRVTSPTAYLDGQPIVCVADLGFSVDTPQQSDMDASGPEDGLFTRRRRSFRAFRSTERQNDDVDYAYRDDDMYDFERYTMKETYVERTDERVYKNIDLDNYPINRTLFLNCTDETNSDIICLRIECYIGMLKDLKTATFSIGLSANIKNLESVLVDQDIVLVSVEAIVYPTVRIDNSGGGVHSTIVHTTLLGTLPEKGISLTLIIAAASIGLLILILIIVTMMKCGFFRRDNRDKLELLKSQDDFDMEDTGNNGIDNIIEPNYQTTDNEFYKSYNENMDSLQHDK